MRKLNAKAESAANIRQVRENLLANQEISQQDHESWQKDVRRLQKQQDELETGIQRRNEQLIRLTTARKQVCDECRQSLQTNEIKFVSQLNTAHDAVLNQLNLLEKKFEREIQPRSRERNRLFISLAQDIEHRHLKRNLLMKLLDALVFGLHRMQDYINIGFQHWIENEHIRRRALWLCLLGAFFYWFVLPPQVIVAVRQTRRFCIDLLRNIVYTAVACTFAISWPVVKFVLLAPYNLMRFAALTVPQWLNSAGQALINFCTSLFY